MSATALKISLFGPHGPFLISRLKYHQYGLLFKIPQSIDFPFSGKTLFVAILRIIEGNS
jgi:hypothetical protein